jgi:hypothetical protein
MWLPHEHDAVEGKNVKFSLPIVKNHGMKTYGEVKV